MLEATNIIHQPQRLVSMLVGQPPHVIKQYEESYSGSHLWLAKCAWKCRLRVELLFEGAHCLCSIR